MNDIAGPRRGIWIWIVGAVGVLVVLVAGTFFMSGTPVPGWMAHADLDQLEALHSRRPMDNEVSYYYAHALMASGKNTDAYKLMTDVVAREPKSERYLLRLAHYAAMRGRARETVNIYRRILALDPLNAEAHSEVARILADAGLLSEALQEYDQALKIDPKIEYDPQRYAQCLLYAGRYEQAWKQLESTIKSVPLQDAPYPLLAVAGAKLGKFDDTEMWILRRLKMDQIYPVNLYQAALARLFMAKPRSAKTLHDAQVWAQLATQKLRGTAEEQPIRAEYFALYASVLEAEGRLPDARAAVQSGLKFDPKDKECLREMAHLSDRTHDPRAAYWHAMYARTAGETDEIVALRKAVENKPGDAAATLKLATGLEQQKRYADAADIGMKALALTPGEPNAVALEERCRSQALQVLEAQAKKRYSDLD